MGSGFGEGVDHGWIMVGETVIVLNGPAEYSNGAADVPSDSLERGKTQDGRLPPSPLDAEAKR
jgi:hypothetical protein